MLKHAGMLKPESPIIPSFRDASSTELEWRAWLHRESKGRYVQMAVFSPGVGPSCGLIFSVYDRAGDLLWLIMHCTLPSNGVLRRLIRVQIGLQLGHGRPGVEPVL
jgi:hypothetical protein